MASLFSVISLGSVVDKSIVASKFKFKADIIVSGFFRNYKNY